MKFTAVSIFLLLHFFAFAQKKYVDKNIEVGMLVKISKCKPQLKSFKGIDLYTKTRFPESFVKVDTVTGDGVFESFFSPGDFDTKPLPCQYSGKKYKIAAIRIFDVKREEKRVLICYTGSKRTMIWIEIDKALELKEVEF